MNPLHDGILAVGENGWLLPGDINEVYWGSAAFAIVFGLFLWKGVPAIKRAMAQRTETIKADLAAADVAAQEAADRRAAQQKTFANVDAEAAAIKAEGQSRAEALEADLRTRAEADIEATKVRARAEIEASRTQAMADLRAEVAARTAAAAEAVVGNSLDDATHSALIDQYIDQVGATR